MTLSAALLYLLRQSICCASPPVAPVYLLRYSFCCVTLAVACLFALSNPTSLPLQSFQEINKPFSHKRRKALSSRGTTPLGTNAHSTPQRSH